MEVTRTFDLLERYLDVNNKDDVLAAKINGEWVTFSAEDYYNYATFLSYGFMELGFKRGDKIATVFNNRPEWNFVDMALSMLGIVHVPLYPTLNPTDYEYLFSHCDAIAAIISNKVIYNRVKVALKKSTNLKSIFTVDEIEGENRLIEVVKLGATVEEKYKEKLIEIKASIKPKDLLTIIYTSGTTGAPKGVMLSHNNLLGNAIACSEVQPLDSRHKMISFLPICHVYERMINLKQQYKGISIYYAENIGTVIQNVKETNADGFSSVPRVLEKIYDKLLSTGKNLTGIKKIIYMSAFRHGLKFDYKKKSLWFKIKQRYADKLIYHKWREAMGGKNLTIICGGSSIQDRIIRLLTAAGMAIYEGYGLTETSPVIAVSNPTTGEIKIGTVGPILRDAELKFGKDGEILTKGPYLMMGYYKDPEYTNSVIDKDGWFHTGDIGELIDDTFLKITDRKKEIFKLSAGKYIAPQIIENILVESIFIESSCVIGEGEKFASALISPNFNHLHTWAQKQKLFYRDNKELVRQKEVISYYHKEIAKMNKRVAPHEQVKRFRLVCDEWSAQTGELSPTLKLRRNIIHKNYATLMKDIYKSESRDKDFLPRFRLNYSSWNVPTIKIKDIKLKELGKNQLNNINKIIKKEK